MAAPSASTVNETQATTTTMKSVLNSGWFEFPTNEADAGEDEMNARHDMCSSAVSADAAQGIRPPLNHHHVA